MHAHKYIGLLFGFGSLALLLSCQPTTSPINEAPPQRYAAPEIIPLDTAEGYAQNAITGEEIPPIINAQGDTVVTGRLLPVKTAPVYIPGLPRGTRRQVSLGPAMPGLETATPSKLTIAASGLTWDSPKVITTALVNTIGDTIPTNQLVPVEGKIVAARNTEPVQALPLRYRDIPRYSIQYLDVNQGLNSSYVFCMLQDSRGYLWFGSDLGGVTRYDGNTLKYFTLEEGLSTNYILSILEDNAGNLWFGTEGGGLIQYTGKHFIHYTETEGMADSWVYDMVEDKQGRLWLATRQGITRFDGTSFTHFGKSEGLNEAHITSLTEDNDGTIWAVSSSQVYRWNVDRFESLQFPQGELNLDYKTILADRNGRIWIGTMSQGIYCLQNNQLSQLEGYTDGILPAIDEIMEDRDGNLWFGSATEGVIFYDGTTLLHLSEEEGLSHHRIGALMEDRNGNVWIGTRGGGINRYTRNTFAFYTEQEGLSYNRVLSVVQDRNQNLWLGTQAGGVSMYDGTAFRHLGRQQGFEPLFVRAILEDQQGSLWFGTRSGKVLRYDGTTLHEFSFSQPGWSNNYIKQIIEDSQGHIWFAVRDHGLVRYDGQGLYYYSDLQGLADQDVNALALDSKGNLWIGSEEGGISYFDGKHFKHFSEREGLLTHQRILDLHVDSKDNLWIGTENDGVIHFDGQSFTHYRRPQGLNNNSGIIIIEDENSRIWVGTEKGLSCFIPNQENDDYHINTLTSGDGLKATDFLFGACIDNQNQFWFGTGKALTQLNLNRFSFQEESPNVHLQNIKINDQFVDFHNFRPTRRSGLEYTEAVAFNNYPEDLNLSHNQNHLTFTFSSLSWGNQERIQYSHFMDGQDHSWSTPSTEREAEYRNLPAGKFTLHVRAIGPEQQWSEPFTYTFTILHPWWLTWWAWLGYGFLAILLLITGFRWRTAQLRAQQAALEQQVTQRTAQLELVNKKLRGTNEEILNQRTQIEHQKSEIETQKQKIEFALEDLQSSIEYAEKIQKALLGTEPSWKAISEDYFILYKPKEAVSGDFYWAHTTDTDGFWTVADCTGHGVPGALMSMLGVTFLNEVVVDGGTYEPGRVLDLLRYKMSHALQGEGMEKEGMDMAFCRLNRENLTLTIAGAYNPVLLARSGKEAVPEGYERMYEEDDYRLYEFKTDRMSVGRNEKKPNPFTTQTIQLLRGDTIYLYTDGIQDQFGGPFGKKYMARRLKYLLLSLQGLSLAEQQIQIHKTFHAWVKGTDLGQIDDVTIAAMRI